MRRAHKTLLYRRPRKTVHERRERRRRFMTGREKYAAVRILLLLLLLYLGRGDGDDAPNSHRLVQNSQRSDAVTCASAAAAVAATPVQG